MADSRRGGKARATPFGILDRRMAGVAEEEAALAECGVDVKARSNRVGEKAKE